MQGGGRSKLWGITGAQGLDSTARPAAPLSSNKLFVNMDPSESSDLGRFGPASCTNRPQIGSRSTPNRPKSARESGAAAAHPCGREMEVRPATAELVAGEKVAERVAVVTKHVGYPRIVMRPRPRWAQHRSPNDNSAAPALRSRSKPALLVAQHRAWSLRLYAGRHVGAAIMSSRTPASVQVHTTLPRAACALGSP